MVVLADEILESFFETDLSASFKLVPLPEMELPISSSGLLGDIWSSIATDTNKKMFNMFTDEIGKTIGRHQVIHKPSIGRYTKLEEPKARESLLTPSMRKSASKSSLKSAASSTAAASTSSIATATSSTVASTTSSSLLTVRVPSQEISNKLGAVPESGSLSAMPMMKAARDAALMERTPFAIDNAQEGDEDDDDFFDDDEEDDQVLDEVILYVNLLLFEADVGHCYQVDAFLEAHDSGLTEADKKVAQGTLFPLRGFSNAYYYPPSHQISLRLSLSSNLAGIRDTYISDHGRRKGSPWKML